MRNETGRKLFIYYFWDTKSRCIMLLLRFQVVKEIILIAKQKHQQLD